MLWPPRGDEITDAELERVYAYPEDLDRPWVQVNFISSIDGAVTVGGKSGGLGNPADKKVFALNRTLADVVLVGASTALVEEYHGIKAGEVRAEQRARFGLSPVPPIAVVTATCSLLPTSPLLTDTSVPPIVLTTDSAPVERRKALADAGADVVIAGDDELNLSVALRALGDRGLRRVNCEGGPRLLGSLIADDLVDEMCLTVAPLLAGGDAGRIAHGPLPPSARPFTLDSVLHFESALLLRYRRTP